MSSLTTYKNLSIVTPDPAGFGGLAINNNFKSIADSLANDFSFQGTWSISTAYFSNNVVLYSGSYYVATEDNTGQTPSASSSYWSPIAAGYLPLTGGTVAGDIDVSGQVSVLSGQAVFGTDSVNLNYVSLNAYNGGIYGAGVNFNDLSGDVQFSVGAQNLNDPGTKEFFISDGISVQFFSIDGSSSAVSTVNNTLDDGNGNMTVLGNIVGGNGAIATFDLSGSIGDATGLPTIYGLSVYSQNDDATALSVNDSVVSTRFNTLDDGSGNMTVHSNLTVNGAQSLLSNGSVLYTGSPGVSFVSYTNCGLGSDGGNLSGWVNGIIALNLTDRTLNECRIPSDYKFAFASTTTNNEPSDTAFYRASAGVLRTAGSFVIDSNMTVSGRLNASNLPSGTLASPPSGLSIGDLWMDTTTSSQYPIVRIKAT